MPCRNGSLELFLSHPDSRRARPLLMMALIVLSTVPASPAAQERIVRSDGSVETLDASNEGPPVLRPRWISPSEAAASSSPADDNEASSSDADDGEASSSDAEAGAIASGPVTPWIIVHSRDAGDALLDNITTLLRDTGEQLVDSRLVNVDVSVDQIRYFHPGDEALASNLAARLDGIFDQLEVRDFTFYRPSPARGMLEVWLR